MTVAEALGKGRVLINTTGTSKGEIIGNLLALLVQKEVITESDTLLEAFLDREAKGSTGIGNGIAIPHVRSEQVSELEYVFANSTQGLDFDSLDGEPVHIIFLMVAPAGMPGVHIRALAKISRILSDELTRLRLRKATSAEEVIQVIQSREEELG
jgi:fructose-specific phosphotransferase system IIA component